MCLAHVKYTRRIYSSHILGCKRLQYKNLHGHAATAATAAVARRNVAIISKLPAYTILVFVFVCVCVFIIRRFFLSFFVVVVVQDTVDFCCCCCCLCSCGCSETFIYTRTPHTHSICTHSLAGEIGWVHAVNCV